MLKQLFKEMEMDTAKETAKRAGLPAIELREQCIHGGGTSTEHLYKVEIRTSYSNPTVLGEGERAFVIDHCWRELPIRLGATQWGLNVPIRPYDRHAAEHGMVGYTAAEAHRWGFLAWLEANQIGGTLCIETRLVKVELQKTYKTREMGVTAAMQRNFGPKDDDLAPRTPNAKAEAA